MIIIYLNPDRVVLIGNTKISGFIRIFMRKIWYYNFTSNFMTFYKYCFSFLSSTFDGIIVEIRNKTVEFCIECLRKIHSKSSHILRRIFVVENSVWIHRRILTGSSNQCNFISRAFKNNMWRVDCSHFIIP